MKRNVRTFGQFTKARLNEQDESSYNPDAKLLWIQTLNGTIQWMTVTDWDNVDVMKNEGGLAYAMEEGDCDFVTIVDITNGGDIYSGGNQMKGEGPVAVDDATIVETIDIKDFLGDQEY